MRARGEVDMNHRPGIEHWIPQWAQQQINDGLCLDLGKGGGRTSSYHVDNAPDSIHRYMLEQTSHTQIKGRTRPS